VALVVIYPSNAAHPVELAPKDPDAVIPYSFDWSDWLGGETILTSEWIVPAGITLQNEAVDAPGQITTIVLSGGTAGETYLITNRITTATRTEDRSMRIPVRTR
jgi:hypothetical protein